MKHRWLNALVAVGAAAAMGGLGVAIVMIVAMGVGAVMAVLSGSSASLWGALSGAGMVVGLAAFAAVYAGAVFAVGLFVIGLPVWAILHGLGFRTRVSAVVAGAVVASATAAVLMLTASGWSDLTTGVWAAALLALPGAAAGWTFHKTAYGSKLA